MYQPIPSYTVSVDSTISSLADFAAKYGISFHTLKFLNPWLMNDRLSNSQKLTYFITLPKKDVPFAELGEDIIYSDSIFGYLCSFMEAATSTAKPDSAHPKIIVHIVQPDETMESIAKQYNVTLEQLRTWNSISDTVKVKARDELMIFEKQ